MANTLLTPTAVTREALRKKLRDMRAELAGPAAALDAKYQPVSTWWPRPTRPAARSRSWIAAPVKKSAFG